MYTYDGFTIYTYISIICIFLYASHLICFYNYHSHNNYIIINICCLQSKYLLYSKIIIEFMIIKLYFTSVAKLNYSIQVNNINFTTIISLFRNVYNCLLLSI